MENEEMSVFKSYLRRLLHELKEIKKLIENKDFESAEKLTDILIEDTQKGIEDN